MRPIHSSHRVPFFALLMCGASPMCAQQWELPPRTLEVFLDTFPTQHVALSLEGDVLAISRCTPAGGEVRLHRRNAGGADQWEAFAVLNDPRRGFGFSLDLDQGRLAIGIPGGTTWESEAGAVRILEVDPANIIDPVIDLGEFTSDNGLPSDRFGQSVLWQGDHLFVGATGRSHTKGSGAVYVFDFEQGGLLQQGMLQPDPLAFQLPVLGKFGAALACNGSVLAIASPGSGFGYYTGPLVTGAVHLYEYDPASPSGWTAAADLYDAEITIGQNDYGNATASLATNDIGREGVFLMDSLLLVHYAERYDQFGIADDGSSMPLLDPACKACRMRAYRLGGNGTWIEDPGGSWPSAGLARSRKGWTWDGERAFATVYDTLAAAWHTNAYEVGPDSWSITATLPGLSGCDAYNGPVAASPDRLVRTAFRQGGACTPLANGVQVVVEIFDRLEEVGVDPYEVRKYPAFQVSPSPASDQCRLTFPDAGPWRITIRSASGEQVRSGMIIPERSTMLDLCGTTPGVYLLFAEHLRDGRRAVSRLITY